MAVLTPLARKKRNLMYPAQQYVCPQGYARLGRATMQDLATVDITTSWLMINCTRRAGWVRVHQGPCNSTDHAQCRTCCVCPG